MLPGRRRKELEQSVKGATPPAGKRKTTVATTGKKQKTTSRVATTGKKQKTTSSNAAAPGKQKASTSPQPKVVTSILRAIFEVHIYKELQHMIRHIVEYEKRFGKHVAQIGEVEEFGEVVYEPYVRALQNKSKLKDDMDTAPYFQGVFAENSPMDSTIDFVKFHSTRELGPNTTKEKFLFKVSIEDKIEAIKAVVDVCIKKVLEYNEQDMFSYDNIDNPLPEGVKENLKSELGAPFAKL